MTGSDQVKLGGTTKSETVTLQRSPSLEKLRQANGLSATQDVENDLLTQEERENFQIRSTKHFEKFESLPIDCQKKLAPKIKHALSYPFEGYRLQALHDIERTTDAEIKKINDEKKKHHQDDTINQQSASTSANHDNKQFELPLIQNLNGDVSRTEVLANAHMLKELKPR